MKTYDEAVKLVASKMFDSYMGGGRASVGDAPGLLAFIFGLQEVQVRDYIYRAYEALNRAYYTKQKVK